MLLCRRRRDDLKIDAHPLHHRAARGDVEHQVRQQLALLGVGGPAFRGHIAAIGIVHRIVMAGDQRIDALADGMGVHINDGHAIHFTQFSSATGANRSSLMTCLTAHRGVGIADRYAG
jgi:hypothetical protein